MYTIYTKSDYRVSLITPASKQCGLKYTTFKLYLLLFTFYDYYFSVLLLHFFYSETIPYKTYIPTIHNQWNVRHCTIKWIKAQKWHKISIDSTKNINLRMWVVWEILQNNLLFQLFRLLYIFFGGWWLYKIHCAITEMYTLTSS